MSFILSKTKKNSKKLYALSWHEQKNGCILFRPLIIIFMNNYISKNNFGQIKDKPIGFTCTHNISKFNLHKFTKVLSNNFKRNISEEWMINQIADMPIGFICIHNFNDSYLFDFIKVFCDNLSRKISEKWMINQIADKLHSINQQQQTVERVLLSPSQA